MQHRFRIFIKTIKIAEERNSDNLIFSSGRVPTRQRSDGRVRRKELSRLLDIYPMYENREPITIVDGSSSMCPLVDAHPCKPRNTRSKRKPEQSDFVLCERSIPCRKQPRRSLNRSNFDPLKLHKLDSNTFEVFMENICKGLIKGNNNEFTCLDALWFSLYTKGPLKAKVLSWIKNKNIFSKKYVFVPIVQWGHWFLLIFCHFGESQPSEAKSCCILLLDSLQNALAKHAEPEIRRFVSDIYKLEGRSKKKDLINKIPLLIPKVPQQKYGEECGFYVLYYIKLFLESAPDNFSFPTGYPYFMKEDWFTSEDLECFVKTLGSNSMDRSSDSSDQ